MHPARVHGCEDRAAIKLANVSWLVHDSFVIRASVPSGVVFT